MNQFEHVEAEWTQGFQGENTDLTKCWLLLARMAPKHTASAKSLGLSYFFLTRHPPGHAERSVIKKSHELHGDSGQFSCTAKKNACFGHFRGWPGGLALPYFSPPPFGGIPKRLVTRSSSSLKVLLHSFQFLQSLLGWAIVDLFHVLLMTTKSCLQKKRKNCMDVFELKWWICWYLKNKDVLSKNDEFYGTST